MKEKAKGLNESYTERMPSDLCKECPECGKSVAPAFAVCPYCAYEFE